MNRLSQRMSRKNAHDNVHVIGHHAPGEKPVPLIVEVSQRVGHDIRNSRVLKVARSRAVIQIFLDDFSRKLLDLFSFARA